MSRDDSSFRPPSPNTGAQGPSGGDVGPTASDALPTLGTDDHAFLWVGDAADGSFPVAQLSPLELDLSTILEGNSSDGAGDGLAYDENVPLAVDAGVLSSIDVALDLLTSSPDLFDVPSVEVVSADDASG